MTNVAEPVRMKINMNEKNWYVIYTRANAEKKLAARLIARGFEAFLPLNTVTRVWSDRKKTLTEPLFKSYVFVKCDVEELHKVKTTAGFSHYVSFGGYPATVPEEQILFVKSLLSLYADTESMATRFIEGDQVCVISGPLKGRNGILTTLKGKEKVAIEISELGQSMLVTLPQTCIIKMDKKNDFTHKSSEKNHQQAIDPA